MKINNKPIDVKHLITHYIIECNGKIGKSIDLFIILLNFLIVALFVIETYNISERTYKILWIIELIIITFFIIEYAARMYASENKRKQFFDTYNIIDLIAIIPTVLMLPIFGLPQNIATLKIIRIFRVFRIFRFVRVTADPNFFFGKVKMSFLRVIRLMLTIFIIFFISSGLFYYAEYLVNEGISNFGDAFYFTVVTLTTVGFGDITPITHIGRSVTVLMIISGIIFIPWQAGLVVREWIKMSSKVIVLCKHCGLTHHDRDASHCKHCGNIIYQEVEGI